MGLAAQGVDANRLPPATPASLPATQNAEPQSCMVGGDLLFSADAQQGYGLAGYRCWRHCGSGGEDSHVFSVACVLGKAHLGTGSLHARSRGAQEQLAGEGLYSYVQDLGQGAFGLVRLVVNRCARE